MEQLTARQRKHLRARAHHLKPVLTVGVNGLTDAVVEEADRALEHHHLIKAKVVSDDRDLRQALISELCARTGALLVARIGMTATLYRPAADQADDPRRD